MASRRAQCSDCTLSEPLLCCLQRAAVQTRHQTAVYMHSIADIQCRFVAQIYRGCPVASTFSVLHLERDGCTARYKLTFLPICGSRWV